MAKQKKLEINDILLKKAEGYSVKEVVTEYVIDEEGNKKAIKEKQQTKYMPPDMTALKTYMEINEKEDVLTGLTDEDLEKEKIRLLNLLKSSEV